MSSIVNARFSMGWRAHGARRFCVNCAHGGPAPFDRGMAAWRCEKGGFNTPRTAVCEQWKAKK